MKNMKIKTITTVLAALLLVQGVAFADGGDTDDYHHGGSSTFWDNGGGWAAFAAAVIFGGIMLYRSGSRSSGGCGKNAELSPENLKPHKPQSRLQVALLSNDDSFNKEINYKDIRTAGESADTIKMAMVVKF